MNNVIVDDIRAVVTAMKDPDAVGFPDSPPYFMAGHRLEIANRLLEKDQDKVAKYLKYPLIALLLDIKEERQDGIIKFPSINIAILEFTEIELNSEERIETKIKPVLIPLYESFMVELKKSGLFILLDNDPKHTKIDRPFWGTASTEGNVKYIFNDPLDGVEIISLELKQRIKPC